MSLFWSLIFWLFIFLVGYSYVLYPLLLAYFSRNLSPKNTQITPENLPEVAVLVAAYNEEAVIEEKIRSVLSGNYPREKLSLWIGNDASTDKTAAIIVRLQHEFSNLYLINFAGRTGKPQIINQLVENVKSEIIIPTDANIIFEQETILRLIQPFAEEKTGFVAANISSKKIQKEGISLQEDAYVKREIYIKYQQSVLSKVVIAPFGACYALRKKLYVPVPLNYNVDDFFVAMKIMEQKYWGWQSLDAMCYEDISQQISEEFRRKSRISKGNFQNLATFKHLFFFPFSALSFHFISHKVIRWLTPILMFFIFVSNFALAMSSNFYQILLLGQILVYFIPLLDLLLKKIHIHLKVFRFISYFLSMNVALLMGLWEYLKGVESNIWEPTKRNQN